MKPEQKCGTFTEEAQKQRTFISVEKSLLDALRKDRERLTWLLEKQDRYLHDDIWEKAAESCPVDFDEAEQLAKWGRVGIDALMAIEDALRARLTPRTDSAPVNRPFLALRDKVNGCGKAWWIVRWDETEGWFESVPGGYQCAVTTWMDLPEVTP